MEKKQRTAKHKQYHHGDLRRALIQQAALDIETEGIEALTLRGLARDLGVSHGAPNRHFRKKSELLAALATEAYQQANHATIAAALLIEHPVFAAEVNHVPREELIAELMELVVPTRFNKPTE